MDFFWSRGVWRWAELLLLCAELRHDGPGYLRPPAYRPGSGFPSDEGALGRKKMALWRRQYKPQNIVLKQRNAMPPSQPPRAAAMERKTKTVFQLETPFTSIQWPEVQSDHQDTILELLCSILSPIGQYRSNHVVPSKGKRSRKRKRKEEVKTAVSSASATPPLPEIASFVVVGLNSVTRSLESLSKASKPKRRNGDEDLAMTELRKAREAAEEGLPNTEGSTLAASHFSVIFAASSRMPTILHAHLPQLVATASMAHPQLPVTRLVQLPKSSGSRLSQALGLPRVSFIGLQENAPHTKVLVDFIRGNVPEVKIMWLQEAQKAAYMPLNTKGIEKFAPVAKK